MTEKTNIKKLLNNSLVYFVGNAANRLGVFVLLPVYTNYLSPEEYGMLELVLITVAFLRIFLGMRLGHSTLRFFFEYESEDERRKLISTSVLAVTFWCLIIVFMLMFSSKYISQIVNGSETYEVFFIIGFLVMFFEVINEIPFAFFRAKEYSILYVSSSLLQLILRVALNVYIVIYLNEGVKGILIGNLISAFVVWILLCFVTFKYSGISFDMSKLKDLWKYSYPLVIASLPGLAVRNADRLFLGWYASLEVVGVYALAVRFGLALQGFILEPFQLGYGPFRFKIMRQENAKYIYSRILTYFFASVVFIGLIISLLSREVIELMASESYMTAYKIVPLLIVATIINGVTYIFQTGLLIEKRTAYFPYISVSAAVINILLLFLLVPSFGIYGAAFALIVTMFVEMVLTFIFSQKLYSISFEYNRIIKIVVVSLLIYFICDFASGMDLGGRLLTKTCIVFTFPVLLFFLKFYKSDELEKLSELIKKIGLRKVAAYGTKRR